MAMQSSACVLLYADMTYQPEYAMALASRMVATAFEAHDQDGVQRWTRTYAELKTLIADQLEETRLAEVG